MRTDETWILRALDVARMTSVDVPVGCVILCEGAQIAAAHNSREQEQDPTAHAEILALRQAATVLRNWRLLECTVFVTLEPCPMCAGAIIQSRVKRVVFGAYDAIAGAAGSRFNLFEYREAVPVPEIVGGVCEPECRRLLQEFFKERRKQGR